MTTPEPLRFLATEGTAEVSALLQRPPSAKALLLLAHGAGADMHHRFMTEIAQALVDRELACLRYQFPYAEQGRRRPDPRPRLLATVRAAAAEARRHAGDLPLVAGGKSMGGRMTSMAAAEGGLDDVLGLVFLGFPLHPAGKPGTERAEHLARVQQPMVFVQGTRDKLAELPLLRGVLAPLGDAAHLHVIEDGDHSFAVRKTRGHDPDAVLVSIADAVVGWVHRVLAS